MRKNLPLIIQGGMGAGVSDWRLARSVSTAGQIGVVSGTALDLILARRLQMGDPGGHMRRALAAFPDPAVSERIIQAYFVEGGKGEGEEFRSKPMVGNRRSKDVEELLVASNFVEVYLARENHDGAVGINYLHKIQSPLLPSLYGAMLAGVDLILVGAGIPFEVPGILDGLSRGERVELTLHVSGGTSGGAHKLAFDPSDVMGCPPPCPARPLFFPIVSSVALASLLKKKCAGGIDGLIVEGPTAGGHNAPPRGQLTLTETGEPVYGDRDVVDCEAVAALGVPFWLAGAYGSPEKLREALSLGAAGVQVGTLFAFCEESGLRTDLKEEAIHRCASGTARVFTDPVASPTGFPFKVLAIEGTMSDTAEYTARVRRCDLGYLRESFEKADGTLGWRCAAEEPDIYESRGGEKAATSGRKCLCNALMANIGLAQVRDGGEELPLVTCGDDLSGIPRVVRGGEASYSSSDVIAYLLGAGASG